MKTNIWVNLEVNKETKYPIMITKVIAAKITEKVNNEDEKVKRCATIYSVKLERNTDKTVEMISKMKDYSLKVKIPFHCCDSCGVGFGVIDYPEKEYNTYEQPILVKVGNGKIELCKHCHERNIKNKIKLEAILNATKSMKTYEFLHESKEE